MKVCLRRFSVVALFLLLVSSFFSAHQIARATCFPDLPSPDLVCSGSEIDNRNNTHYLLEVPNSIIFPDELFEDAPHLPPCGATSNSARTWVTVFDNNDNRLNGFCVFDESDDLNTIRFVVPQGTIAPQFVYITIHDRECDIVYTSNLARICTDQEITCHPDLPSPELICAGKEIDNQNNTDYLLKVTNSIVFPDELFEDAPHLPPCEINTNSSRTWIEVFDNRDNRLNGFCAFDESDDLNTIRFVVTQGATPPQSVYIVIHDRECDIEYTSNHATVCQIPEQFASEPSVAREGNVAEEDITVTIPGPVETLGSAGSDIELTSDPGEGKQQMVGIRFPNIFVPQGATIRNAYIQFESDENSNGPAAIIFQGEATDNASPFQELDGDVSNRLRTTASIGWNPGNWNTGDKGGKQKTSNLASIVDEIVSRPGWAQGNAIVFIVSSNDFPNHRTAENGENNGPVLTIEFENSISTFSSEPAVAREGNVAEEDITVTIPGPVETLESAGSDIELTSDAQEGKQQMIGIRFPNILVPQDATIRNAYIQFESDENSNGPATIIFHGEATDNANLFQELDGDVSNRLRTTVSIDWDPGNWNTGDKGGEQKTSNLASIVDEIVSRPGWAQGNAIAFIVSSNDFPNHRTAENGGSNGPVLTIEYESNISIFSSEPAVAREGNVAEENITVTIPGPVETLGSAGSDIELTSDTQEGKQQMVGIRFPNMDIPNGATIVDAFIQFESDENQNGPVNITIYGEASDNANLFQEIDGDVSNRLKTSMFVDWRPDDWSVGDAGNKQRTPDLTAIAQEVVNRQGWGTGNAMAFIFSSSNFPNHRTAENGKSNGPALIINYR